MKVVGKESNVVLDLLEMVGYGLKWSVVTCIFDKLGNRGNRVAIYQDYYLLVVE